MIPSAVHSVTRLPMVFSGPEMPKISPPVGALDLHLTYTGSSLGPGLMQVHTPNGTSIASAIFAGFSHDQQKHSLALTCEEAEMHIPYK